LRQRIERQFSVTVDEVAEMRLADSRLSAQEFDAHGSALNSVHNDEPEIFVDALNRHVDLMLMKKSGQAMRLGSCPVA
jgi:hypothetical protein